MGRLGFNEISWARGTEVKAVILSWVSLFNDFLFVFRFSFKLGLEIDRPWPNSFI